MWGHQTNGFSGAEFKSFPSREEAEEFMGNAEESTPGPAMSQTSSAKLPAHSPVPVTVKRSRSLSPGPGRASTIAQVRLSHVRYCQGIVLMSGVIRNFQYQCCWWNSLIFESICRAYR